MGDLEAQDGAGSVCCLMSQPRPQGFHSPPTPGEALAAGFPPVRTPTVQPHAAGSPILVVLSLLRKHLQSEGLFLFTEKD